MTVTDAAVQTVGFYVDGKWETPQGLTLHPITNPATGETMAEMPYASAEEVDRAVRAAHEAFLKWRDVPVVDRVQVLYRYKDLLEKNSAEVAPSCRGERQDDGRRQDGGPPRHPDGGSGLRHAQPDDGPIAENVSEGIDCKTIRQPLGVCAGITPFNFPAMVPMWMYPFAIACGNTFILKPSEKVPLTPTRIAELLHEAGLPAGVFNLLHGDTRSGGRVAAASAGARGFVCRLDAGGEVHLHHRGRQGKRVQALGGAKNHLVVMPDADMAKTVEAIIGSAFGAAGERCLAGSVLVPVGDAAGPLLDLLVKRTNAIKVGEGSSRRRNGAAGDGRTSPARGGIHREGRGGRRRRLCAMAASLKTAERRLLPGPDDFRRRRRPSMTIAREEIFGPVLSVIRVETLDEAIDLVNSSPFGNTTSIFTSNGKSAREYASRVEAGMVGVNVGVAAPMAFFPFSGWKNSFFGDLHAHGKDAIAFYTEQKVIMSRWF